MEKQEEYKEEEERREYRRRENRLSYLNRKQPSGLWDD